MGQRVLSAIATGLMATGLSACGGGGGGGNPTSVVPAPTSPVVVSIAVMLGSASVTSGTPAAVPVTITAKDAAGNTIVGAYSDAITLVDADSSGATSLSVATIPTSSTAVTLTYNGSAAFSSATISAAASGVQSSRSTPATLTKGTSGASGPVAFMSAATGSKVSGSIASGTTAALVAILSGAPDQSSPSHNPVPSDSLTVGAGMQAQAAARSASAQSVGRYESEPSRLSPVEAFPADGAFVRRIIRSFATGIVQRSVRTLSTIPSSPSVGAMANIWVGKSALGSSTSTQVQVPAVLEFQSAHGNLWVDSSLLSGPNQSPDFQSGSLQATVAAIGADFENAYGSDTAHFASPDYSSAAPGLQTAYRACSADGATTGSAPGFISEPADKRINVMLLNPAALGTGVGGYFSGANFLTQAVINCSNGSSSADPIYSNEAPFFFIGWFQNNGAQFELQEDVVRSTAHEFQHLINFVNHQILATNAASEEPFVDEGLAMLAQDLAVPAMFPSLSHDAADALHHASAYLANPGNYSVSGFIGADPVGSFGSTSTAQQYNCGGGCYGSAFLFQRYMRDRFGGDAYTRAMETGGAVGYANLQNNCACSETGTQLLQDFALAMGTNTLGVKSSDPRFAFGSLNLTGTYVDQFGSSIGLRGVFATQLDANASTTVQALAGGFAYASLVNIPGSGVPVTINDANAAAGFALAGGLVQH